MIKKSLLNQKDIHIILHRFCCQLIENHDDFSQTALIGMQPRGIYLAARIVDLLKTQYNVKNIVHGTLDVTFFRDDFRRNKTPLKANQTNISFLIEGKKVVLIDDVLFSGRSINAALAAIQSYGRPVSTELLILINRRFSRELPIQPDYTGRNVDAIDNERVTVHWQSQTEQDAVYIVNNKNL